MGGKRKKDTVINDQFHENFLSKITRVLGFRKLSLSSEIRNDASMHRGGLKG